MVGIDALTLIVDDPGAVAARLSEAFGWEITQDFGTFAEVKAGDGAVVWLNIPGDQTSSLQQGVVLHYQVDDVAAATAKARKAGATILREPTVMDFGMESAYAQVENGPIVDLTKPTT